MERDDDDDERGLDDDDQICRLLIHASDLDEAERLLDEAGIEWDLV